MKSLQTGGAKDCTNCPKGKINTMPGQTSCTNCTHGKLLTVQIATIPHVNVILMGSINTL